VAARKVDHLRRLLPRDAVVLVVGGGTVGNGTEALYADPGLRLIAFDILPTEVVQVVADGHRIPLLSGSVDAVVVQAVLEHVLDPAQVVAEIHRVLRPGGLVYAETPFMQQVHAGRYDFTRFSDSGHRWLFRRFSEVERGVVAGPGTALTWSIDHLVRALCRSRTAGQLARLVFFWLRFADRFADARYAADGASALYFLGRRAERSLTPAEVLAGYTGAQREESGEGTPSSP
jgi:SAM-dependent methyltransferase